MTDKSPDERRDEPGDADESRDADRSTWRPSRRRLIQSAGAAGFVGGLSGIGLAQTQGQTTEIRLGGEVAGWTILGDFQADFLGEGPNPTLNLNPGQQYEVFWRNLDGLPHNFAIVDAQGDYLVRSDIISQQGATQTVTFTAEENMAEYLCEVHPNSMRGDVQFTGGGQTPTQTGTPAQGGPFFEQGARVGVQRVAGGMTAPTDFAVANDGTNRQFVTDQTGEVWIITDQGRQDEPFVDVSDRIVELGRFWGDYADQQQEYDERGLLGIAFHPDYQNNRKFYLHYSAPPDGVDQSLPADNWDHWEILSEFQATQDGSQGQPDSERRLLEIPSPQYNHDAGPFGFGPDGYLYFPMGDGGGANDNMYGHVEDWYQRNGGGNGQDVTDNLMGSVLRINPDQPQGGKPYSVPQDNPFVGTEGLSEIYAYGFRNPFGFSIDSDGNMFVADAGQNLYEEADLVEKGGNYGWNVKEGTHCFSTENPSDPTAIIDCPETEPQQAPYDGSPLLDPIVEFPHQYQGQSVGITIVGGHRYEQSTVAEIQGKYVYGVWTTDPTRQEPQGRVLTAEPPADFGGGGTETGTPTETDTATETATETSTEGEGSSAADIPRDQLWNMRELVFANAPDGNLPFFVRMFGQGADGEIYVLVSERGIPQGSTGAVLKLVPPEQGERLTPAGTETPSGTATATETGTGTGTPVEDAGEEPGDATATDSGTGTGTETTTETETQ